MIGKYSLRIKLDDFIKKDCEDKILSILEKLQSSTPAIVSLILWMDDDFVGNLKEVIDSIQGARHSKTNIIQKSTIKESDFICHAMNLMHLSLLLDFNINIVMSLNFWMG